MSDAIKAIYSLMLSNLYNIPAKAEVVGNKITIWAKITHKSGSAQRNTFKITDNSIEIRNAMVTGKAYGGTYYTRKIQAKP